MQTRKVTWQDELDDILKDLRTMIVCLVENEKTHAFEEGRQSSWGEGIGSFEGVTFHTAPRTPDEMAADETKHLSHPSFESLLRNQWRK